MSVQDSPSQPANFAWVCQAISATEEVCKSSATCHCAVCGKWFCTVHAEEEAWHQCATEPREEAFVAKAPAQK